MKPQTFDELFDFYQKVVKLLYSAVQADNNLPQETLFEISAAFDHLSRHWTDKEGEAFVAEKVYSHLKRGCLDIFKIFYRDTIEEHKRLLAIDTSIIDNGRYDAAMGQLIVELKQGARDARTIEGRRAEDGIDEAFARWAEVAEKCERFHSEFALNPHVDWARRKASMYSLKAFVIAILASIVAGILISPAVLGLCRKLFDLVFAVNH